MKTMSQSPLSGSRAILVLGMHRSGTSALTGTLAKLGVAVGDDAEHLAPRPDNPKGFWENADVFRIHEWLLAQLDVGWDDIRPMPKDWLAHPAVADAKDQLRLLLEGSMAERALWAVKDPRLCRLLPMWRELLDELGVEWLPLFCVRHPLEVAKSLADRDGLDAAHSHAVWLRHMVEAGIETQLRTRGVVSYEALLSDWRGESARIAEAFAIRWPDQSQEAAAAIEAFLESGDRHHHEPADNLGQMPAIVAEAYEALLRARTSGDGWRDFDRLNSQIARFSNAYDQAMQEVLWDRFRPKPELVQELKDTLASQRNWFNVITAYWLERRERDEAFDALRTALDMQAGESARAHAANASMHEIIVALQRDETRLLEESARAHADNASMHEILGHVNQDLDAERSRYAELHARTRSLPWLFRRLLYRAIGRG
jgi:hypothetical protein